MADAITWFDIPTTDFDRAIKFYSDIMGAPIRVEELAGMKMGFFPTEGREGVGGNIISSSPDAVPGPQGNRIYINCDGRLDEVIGRVEPAGGQVVGPKFKMDDALGWIAHVRDTEGNVVGLHSAQ